MIRCVQLGKNLHVIKDQNANWMLEGKYDNAKQALITTGRACFKKAMDLVTEWMEENNEKTLERVR